MKFDYYIISVNTEEVNHSPYNTLANCHHLEGLKEMFYLQLYSIGHIVKYHSDSKRGNPLSSLHGLLFYMHHLTDRIAHTTGLC